MRGRARKPFKFKIPWGTKPLKIYKKGKGVRGENRLVSSEENRNPQKTKAISNNIAKSELATAIQESPKINTLVVLTIIRKEYPKVAD